MRNLILILATLALLGYAAYATLHSVEKATGKRDAQIDQILNGR